MEKKTRNAYGCIKVASLVDDDEQCNEWGERIFGTWAKGENIVGMSRGGGGASTILYAE